VPAATRANVLMKYLLLAVVWLARVS